MCIRDRSYVKQCVGYKLTDEEKPWEDWLMNGFNSYGEGPYIIKPNATVLKVPEGMIIETGKPFTLSLIHILGPRYFGIDTDYIPVEERSARKGA